MDEIATPLAALVGVVLGAALSFASTWWLAREARRSQREESDRAVRVALAEKHEQREVTEFERYVAYLDSRRAVTFALLRALATGDHVQHGEAIGPVNAPALVFVPAEIAGKLKAAEEDWRQLLLTGLQVATAKGPQPARAKEFEAAARKLRPLLDEILSEWASRLRSGAALLEHKALTSAALAQASIVARRPP